MLKILIADSDLVTLNSLSDYLSNNYEVFLAASGPDTEAIIRQYRDISCMLINSHIAGEYTEDLIRSAIEQSPDIYVFLMASDVPSKRIEKSAKAMGAAGAFYKPFSRLQLQTRLDFYLINNPKHKSV